MPVPSGTWTPWQLWDDDEDRDEGFVRYLRDGHDPGASDYLAEAVRMDGLLTLGRALRAAENATLSAGWYGSLPGERHRVFCDEDGVTDDGEVVERVIPCVVARVYVET